ncbi:methyl-accepting chemotaxis protein, partial [Melaminivora alkalimesophila]
MKGMRLSHKLWMSVLVIVLALAAVVGGSAYRSASTQAVFDATTAEIAQRQQLAGRWLALTELNAARTLALVLSSEQAVEQVFQDDLAATSQRISEMQRDLEAMALSDAERAQMNRVAEARSAMVELRTQARKLRDESDYDGAARMARERLTPAVAAYVGALRKLVELFEQDASQRHREMAEQRMMTVKLAGVVVALLVLGIVVGAHFLIRSIQRPLAQANAVAARIAGGDLRAQGDAGAARRDEFGELLASLEAMRAALARTVQQVRQSTDSIAVASAEIAAGNQDLSARTESTSSSLQETAAAMEEFASTLAQSAASASQASQLAGNARDVAQRGGAVVADVVTAMNDIQDSSRRIADIIQVIDSIAFQTNILALNAAVEAARAGEQGRGFAVVAGEVRALAGRSAEAAREINQLISGSVGRVEDGSRLVQQAGGTMQEIVTSVQRVADMIGEVTAAAAEQSAGVGEVNQAVGQLDQMTQQNAALVEQSAAAAQSLRDQAAHLSQVVAMFQVEGAAAAPGAASGARVPMAAAVRTAPAAPAPAARLAVPGRQSTPAFGSAGASASPAPRIAPAR